MTKQHPSIDEVIDDHVVYRHAEALEVSPDEVYAALERVQQTFAPVAETLAEENYILDWGHNYVIFEVKSEDVPPVCDVITRDIADLDRADTVLTVVTIAYEKLYPHSEQAYALPIALDPKRRKKIVETNRRFFDGMHAYRRSFS